MINLKLISTVEKYASQLANFSKNLHNYNFSETDVNLS